MAKTPDRSEELAELIQSGDGELFAAFTLRAFHKAARDARLRLLDRAVASSDPSAEAVGKAIMRVFAGLAKAWQLTLVEQAALLGLGSSMDRENAGGRAEAEVAISVIDRLAILLNIFEAINTLLPEAGRADSWLRAANDHPMFGGRSALELMMTGLEGLRHVERYLQGERWRC